MIEQKQAVPDAAQPATREFGAVDAHLADGRVKLHLERRQQRRLHVQPLVPLGGPVPREIASDNNMSFAVNFIPCNTVTVWN